MRKTTAWVSASVFALGCGGAAFADGPTPPPTSTPPTSASAPQPGTTQAAEDDQDVEKVTVTAERRKTSVQKTPIAVTVLTGQDLENKGVNNVDQLMFVSPSTTVNNFGQGNDFNIRGIGKAEHNTQTTTGVITYRDGVATFPGYFMGEPYYDIQRIEILRGPQGTFVGQNATGGAVFVTSNNPVIGGDYNGYIAAQIGNYGDYAAQGAVNIPISDTFAARVAFNGEKRDSFYDITGPYTGDDGLQMLSGRVSLLWEPTTQLSVLFKTDYNYQDFGAYNADPVLATNDPFDITANGDLYARDKFGRSVLKIDYFLDSGINIRSVTGYQWGNSAYRADLDGKAADGPLPAPQNLNTFRDSVDEFIWSQEVNIISPSDAKLRWILGAYFQTDLHEFLPGEFVIHLPPPGAGDYILDGSNKVQNAAVFGQLGFNLLDDLELQLGLRYSDSWTKNQGDINQFGLPIRMFQSEKYSAMTGKVSLNWTVDEHNFLYGFVATGFKPGGLNLDVGFGIPHDPFKEEKVTSYELGWKAGFFNGHVRTALDAYYNDYENFQVIIGHPFFSGPGVSSELNVPTATSYGVELQAEAVFGDFSADMGLGLMKSEIGEFFAVDPRNPVSNVFPTFIASFAQCDSKLGPVSAFPGYAALMAPFCHNLDGKDQTYAPEFTFNMGVQYVFHLDDVNTLTPRLNYAHVSEQWATLFEDEARGDLVESRDIFNAQLAWGHDDILVTLYGTNLTDQHYVAAVNSGLRFVGPPRQYGIRLLKAF